ncbi:hypothetical protein ABZY58_12030 [Micromonospora tulbaghiae]|uniref:hypothetical protein n=1 Tax=Micromonospora tulbaghiae TaxID=479978 RepID=UPI0033ACCAA1
MTRLAELAAVRVPLPYRSPAGYTVAVNGGQITLSGRQLRQVDALDLSAALTRAADRLAPPFKTGCGDTVCVSRSVIYFNARPLHPQAARVLAAVLARAVSETALTNHTNQQEATHG